MNIVLDIKLAIQWYSSIQNQMERGDQVETTIEDVLFHSYRYGSYIILRCRPLTSDQASAVCGDDNRGASESVLVASGERPIRTEFTPVDQYIPEKIVTVVNHLVSISKPVEMAESDTTISIAPIFLRQEDENIKYFAAIVSFGEKDVYGTLYLLNESGEIIDKNDKKVFNRILGFTDANRDGIHELMIFEGSGYGGGVCIYTIFQYYLTKKVLFVQHGSIQTVDD